jgi:hypothetical protein
MGVWPWSLLRQAAVHKACGRKPRFGLLVEA